MAEWLSNLPQWTKENLKMIIYVSVVVVVVIAVIFVKWYGKNIETTQKQLELTRLLNQLSQSKMQIIRAHAQGVDISFTLIQAADGLQAIAQNTKSNHMAALALIKRAEALRTELHYRPGTVAERDVTAQIDRAKNSYTEALAKSPFNPSLIAMAKFGLGLCEEELGDFDKAEQIYRDVVADASLEGTPAAEQAKQRLNTMADYQTKVVFKTPSKPTSTDLIQPQIELKAPDSDSRLRGNDTPAEAGASQ